MGVDVSTVESDDTPGGQEEENDQPEVPVSAIEDDLADEGYRRTASECRRESCDGLLWYDHHTLVCSTCWTVIDMEEQRRTVDTEDPWTAFFDNRSEYHQSEETRCVGGFLSAYDWLTSNDTDQVISSLEPEEFYL